MGESLDLNSFCMLPLLPISVAGDQLALKNSTMFSFENKILTPSAAGKLNTRFAAAVGMVPAIGEGFFLLLR